MNIYKVDGPWGSEFMVYTVNDGKYAAELVRSHIISEFKRIYATSDFHSYYLSHTSLIENVENVENVEVVDYGKLKIMSAPILGMRE